MPRPFPRGMTRAQRFLSCGAAMAAALAATPAGAIAAVAPAAPAARAARAARAAAAGPGRPSGAQRDESRPRSGAASAAPGSVARRAALGCLLAAALRPRRVAARPLSYGGSSESQVVLEISPEEQLALEEPVRTPLRDTRASTCVSQRVLVAAPSLV